MVVEGFPFVGAIQPRELRSLELAQHEPLARRRSHARAAPERQPRCDRRRVQRRHALRRRHRHPGDRLAPLSRAPARHAPQLPVVRHAAPPPARARRRGQPGDLVHRCAARRSGLRPDARGVRGDRRVDGQPARASRARRGGQQAAARGRPLLRHGRQPRSRPATTSGTASSTPRSPGACTALFPLFSNSRRVAGGPTEGGIFKCGLQSVDAAISAGVYGSWVPSDAEHARLQAIFPEGVCDWSLGDVGRPGA